MKGRTVVVELTLPHNITGGMIVGGVLSNPPLNGRPRYTERRF